MTEGSISRKIIFFAIPLFIGNLFQQLYNTADSLIVGNFLGSNALAAVSSSGNLIFLMVGFINGIALGAGVVIARYYGAKNKEYLQKAIHTTVAFGLAAGLALTAIGMFLAPKILVLRCFRSRSNISVLILRVPLDLSCTIFLSESYSRSVTAGIR